MTCEWNCEGYCHCRYHYPEFKCSFEGVSGLCKAKEEDLDEFDEDDVYGR